MSDFLTSLVAVVAVLGFMILIHEFGHYAVAKWLGVRVEQFAIGFGKRLVGFRKGETDYRINAIPLGGYVKMSGENPMDERTDDPREFMNHSRWHRFLIAIAGPTMNILLAIVLLTTVYMVHYEYPAVYDEPPVIGWVRKDTPAAKAGFRSATASHASTMCRIPTLGAGRSEGGAESRTAACGGHRTQRRRRWKRRSCPKRWALDQIGYAGWAPKEDTVIDRRSASRHAGRQGRAERRRQDHRARRASRCPALGAMVESLEAPRTSRSRLPCCGRVSRRHLRCSRFSSEKRYRIGIGTMQMKVKTLPFAAALNLSLHENRQNALLILELVKKMVQRKISMRSIEGPIRIGQAAGEAARRKGWTPLMGLTAAISLNLGIFNLLPIPILDGGVILFLLIEGLMRRDISMNIKERVYQAAFVFLVLFAVMVIYNDLMKTIPGLADRLP